MTKGKNDQHYETKLFQSSLNACRVKDGVMPNYIVKTIFDNFVKSAKFDYKCPFKKGIYVVENFKITDKFLPAIPAFVLTKHVDFFLKYHLFNVVDKKTIFRFGLNVYGYYKTN